MLSSLSGRIGKPCSTACWISRLTCRDVLAASEKIRTTAEDEWRASLIDRM
jgi:hypothetical protein